MDRPSPTLDIVSFALDAKRYEKASVPLFIDAQNPARNLNALQLTKLVRTFVAGFQTLGVQKGDRVLVHMTNNVGELSSRHSFFILSH